jgi:hypothetical protein
MLRPRTIRRARERRVAVSREWLQAIDASIIGDIVHPSKDDRVRGMTADFVTVDEYDGPLIPWGRPATTHTLFVRGMQPTDAERRLILLGRPSREVALSFIGAQC